MQKARYNSGFTLIELLLSLAILGIVLAAGYSVYSFGFTTHQRAESQSELQHDTLKVSAFITQALHGATEVQILSSASSVPAVVSDDYNYIYLYRASGATVDSIVFKNKNGLTPLVNQYTNNNNFSLLFINGGTICEYQITGDSGTQHYTMGSKVKLNNTTINSTLTQGCVLKFKINSSIMLQIQGTSIDDAVNTKSTGAIDTKNNTWRIVLSYVTLKNQTTFTADQVNIVMPSGFSGLTFTRKKISNNVLDIVVSGTVSPKITSAQSLSVYINPSAVVEDTTASKAITVNLVPTGMAYWIDADGNKHYVAFSNIINTTGVDPNWRTLVIPSGVGTQNYNVFDYYAPDGVIVEPGVQLISAVNKGYIRLRADTGDIVIGSGVVLSTQDKSGNTTDPDEMVISTSGNIDIRGVSLSAIRNIDLTAGKNIYTQNANLKVTKNNATINLTLTPIPTDGKKHIYTKNLSVSGATVTYTPQTSVDTTTP